MKSVDIKRDFANVFSALQQCKLPLWSLFACAVAAFFISPVWLLLILLVIAYMMALQQNNKEKRDEQGTEITLR